MIGPKRIQLRRTKGWRLPADAIKVSRPLIFGNPFTYQDCRDEWAGTVEEARAAASDLYAEWLIGGDAHLQNPQLAKVRVAVLVRLHLLRGHDLACWCPLEGACHADVLLELANG